MLFDSPHSCPQCNFNFNFSSPHYHFPLCTYSNSNKHYTPPLLQHHIFFPFQTYTTSNNPHPNTLSHHLNVLPAISTIVSSFNQGLGGISSFEVDLPIHLDLVFNNIMHQISKGNTSRSPLGIEN